MQKEHCKERMIELLYSCSPLSNGWLKGQCKLLRKCWLKSMTSNVSNKLVDQGLSDCLMSYTLTPSSVTGVSPMPVILFFVKGPVEWFREIVQLRISPTIYLIKLPKDGGQESSCQSIRS